MMELHPSDDVHGFLRTVPLVVVRPEASGFQSLFIAVFLEASKSDE